MTRKWFYKTKWLARRYTGVLDNRLVRRHIGVQVYSGIYLERRYAGPLVYYLARRYAGVWVMKIPRELTDWIPKS